jgi:hypothetical protein
MSSQAIASTALIVSESRIWLLMTKVDYVFAQIHWHVHARTEYMLSVTRLLSQTVKRSARQKSLTHRVPMTADSCVKLEEEQVMFLEGRGKIQPRGAHLMRILDSEK